MLCVVNEFSRQYDIEFNLTKSEFVIFGADGKYEPTEKMEFDGQVLIAKEFLEHLGNIIHMRSRQPVEKVTHFQNQSKCSNYKFLVCSYWC